MAISRKLQLTLEITICLVIGSIIASLTYVAETKQQVVDDYASRVNQTYRPELDYEVINSKDYQNKLNYKFDGVLSKFDNDYVQDGFVLYPISGPDRVLLLNQAGEIVHEWVDLDVDRAKLLPNCNLLTLHGSKSRMKDQPWSDLRLRASEYSWNGDLVWSYTADDILHHDIERLSNGNTLLLTKAVVPARYTDGIADSLRKKADEIRADVIKEVAPDGKTVWQWNSWEHFKINDCGVRDCVTQEQKNLANVDLDNVLKDLKDWTHINTISVLPENKWYDAGDDRFRPGNILIMPRNFWKVYIIDRNTGELVWEYRGDYQGGQVGGHEPQMIAKGLPGAGNILIFDNGSMGEHAGSSVVLEVNPYNTKLVWFYDEGTAFHSRARGSVQRLANGNTFISEDLTGRAFEVTPEKKIVWEYDSSLIIMRAKKYSRNYCPELDVL